MHTFGQAPAIKLVERDAHKMGKGQRARFDWHDYCFKQATVSVRWAGPWPKGRRAHGPFGF